MVRSHRCSIRTFICWPYPNDHSISDEEEVVLSTENNSTANLGAHIVVADDRTLLDTLGNTTRRSGYSLLRARKQQARGEMRRCTGNSET